MARAVIGAPDVVLADEPTGSLDTTNGQIVLRHLRELHAGGTTIVMVSHDPGIAASADRIVTMRDGAVVADTGSVIRAEAESGAHDGDAPVPHAGLVRRRRHELADLVADALSALTVRPAKALLLILAFLLAAAGWSRPSG
ncbi:hypothetical protein [Arthrobacter sp. NA-172]|uniref:hypothetical protein n=1 Tax=Arthrobacter sp. NA-172 TaxID=3367524 RepID=UPI003754505D